MWTVYAKLYGILDIRCTIRPVHPGISFLYIISLFYLKILYQFFLYFVGGYETLSTKISCHFARFRAE